jgi:predicted MFS family arabinose efflux permease
LLASLGQPGFRPLYVAGFLFGTSRWGLGFLAAYVANDLTSSPRAVQLTGAAMWAPMLTAGAVAGGLADRWDRRRILLVIIGALVPVVVVMSALALTGNLATWMLYPFMVAVGMSWVADMTSRRTLVLDVVGTGLIDNAMALESLSTAVGLAMGVLAGGAVVDALGVGQAFAVLAGLLVVTWGFIAWSGPGPPGSARASVRSRTSPELAGDEPPVALVGGRGPLHSDEARLDELAGFRASLTEGLKLAGSNRPLLAGLGVTVVANGFFFSHTPLVPVFADLLGAGPAGAGLLASAGGVGMMLASLGVARFEPPRGLTYVIGSSVALATLICVGIFTRFVLVYVALLVASTGFGLFAATQSVVIMTSVGDEHRGRAMGLLSMAIGVLPIAMFGLGEVAELIGPRPAVIASGSVGLVAMGLWVGWRREVLAAR